MAMPIQIPRYTVDQVRSFPDDGLRYELLDGFLLVTPAPANLHQVVTTNLTVALHQAVVPSRKARVVSIGELEIGTTPCSIPISWFIQSFMNPALPGRGFVTGGSPSRY